MRPILLPLALVLCLASASASAREAYPTELPLRPLTLPAGMFRVDLGLGYGNASTDTFLGRFSASSASFVPGLSYGLSDRLELGARLSFAGSTNSFTNEWDTRWMPFLSADYLLFDSASVDVAGWVGLGYSSAADALLFSFGIPLRYAVGDRLAIRVADTLVSASSAGGSLRLTLPVVVQAQVLPQLAGELGIVPITFADGFDGLEFSGPGSFTLGLVATPLPALDLRLGTVLPTPGNSASFNVAVGAAYRF